MTSVADQETFGLGGPLSILTRHKRDHDRLERLLRRLADSAPGVEEQRVLHALARLVFPRAFAQDSVVWPEARRVLPEGDALASELQRAHRHVDGLWTCLETLPSGAVERSEVIARLATVLRDDVRAVEDVLLPGLQDTVDVRRLRLLGVAWEVVRRTAPTRPHPVVPGHPPGNVLAALPLAVLDRGRDALEAGSRRFPPLHGPASRAADRLAALAGQAERDRQAGAGGSRLTTSPRRGQRSTADVPLSAARRTKSDRGERKTL